MISYISFDLSKIKVLSFDLDDTLYDNHAHIKNAENAMLDYLHNNFPKTHHLNIKDYKKVRATMLIDNPNLIHDNCLCRQKSVEILLHNLGYNTEMCINGGKGALYAFLQMRSAFRISHEVNVLLQELATKYTLIGLSNGNVDVKAIGLDSIFKFVLQPSVVGKDIMRSKPFEDMFITAQAKLNLEPSAFLHIGDNYDADVVGSRYANWISFWLNPGFGSSKLNPIRQLLPHAEFSSLFELAHTLVRL